MNGRLKLSMRYMGRFGCCIMPAGQVCQSLHKEPTLYYVSTFLDFFWPHPPSHFTDVMVPKEANSRTTLSNNGDRNLLCSIEMYCLCFHLDLNILSMTFKIETIRNFGHCLCTHLALFQIQTNWNIEEHRNHNDALQTLSISIVIWVKFGLWSESFL